MQESGPIPPIEIRQRRASQVSRHRVSSSSHRSHPSPPASPRKTEGPSPASSSTSHPPPSSHPNAHQPLRTRLNSVITRGIELAGGAPSPLAQIYQPLNVVGDEQLDPDQTFGTGGTPPAGGCKLRASHAPPTFVNAPAAARDDDRNG